MIAADTTSINSNDITNTGPTQSQSAPAGIKIDGCPTDPVTGQTNPCYTTITGNTLSVGNATGIAAYSANGVQVYHNNFLKNRVQAFDQTGQNTWDNGYPSGGNFWLTLSAGRFRRADGESTTAPEVRPPRPLAPWFEFRPPTWTGTGVWSETSRPASRRACTISAQVG